MNSIENMENFDDLFEELVSPKKAEEPLKEFSNWVLGISVGLCAFLISESNDLIGQSCRSHKTLYLIILILSMLNTIFCGFNKYLILKRESILSVKQAIFRKIMSRFNLKQIEFNKANEEWEIHMKIWRKEFVKITSIEFILNMTLLLTVVTILLTGFYIILTI